MYHRTACSMINSFAVDSVSVHLLPRERRRNDSAQVERMTHQRMRSHLKERRNGKGETSWHTELPLLSWIRTAAQTGLIQMKLKVILENTWVTYQRSWRRDPDHQRTLWTPHLDCGMCNWILGNLMNSLSWWTLGIKVIRVRGTRVTKRGKEV